MLAINYTKRDIYISIYY